jgi:hypothetical protein
MYGTLSRRFSSAVSRPPRAYTHQPAPMPASATSVEAPPSRRSGHSPREPRKPANATDAKPRTTVMPASTSMDASMTLWPSFACSEPAPQKMRTHSRVT